MSASLDRHEALLDAVRTAFPAYPYLGVVTEYDERPEREEIDEDVVELFTRLKGRQWTEVPADLLSRQPDGYVHLTPEAWVTFLPAWLMRSLDNPGGKNEIREFLTNAMVNCWFFNLLKMLSQAQRDVVNELFAEWKEETV